MTTNNGGRSSKDESPDDAVSPSTLRRDLVEREIFEHAIQLFAERGFAGTSLREIAKATGLTRPALYYYVKSKEDLLTRLVRAVTFDIADALEEVGADSTRPPRLRLHQMVHDCALRQAQDPAQFRLMLRSEAELPSDIAAEYDEGRRRVLNAFVSVIDDGVRAGAFRPVDSRVSAFAVIGMVNWIAWWHHPTDALAAADVATQIADLALASLQEVRTDRPAVLGAGGVLEMLEEDVRRLRLLIEGEIGWG